MLRAIAAGEEAAVKRTLARSPALATATLQIGATRQEAKAYFFEEILHYVYAGDTALHVAAAAYSAELVLTLVSMRANVRAKNRMGAEPIHYAVSGAPGSDCWNPRAQAATIARLIDAGAN